MGRKKSPDRSELLDCSQTSEVLDLKKKVEDTEKQLSIIKSELEQEKIKFQKEMLQKDAQFLQLTK